MSTKIHQQAVQPGISQQVSTRLAFFIAGLGMAAWAPLVPFAKARIGLNDASLGLLLLCIGIGSMLAMPLTGVLTAKWGCRAVILLAGAVLCLDLPLLVLMNTPATMAIALLVFGAAMGIIDVAMNIQAVIVEKASGRAMMSGFHGLFSVGGIVGAGGVSALLWLGLNPLTAIMATVVLMIILLLAANKNLLRGSGEPHDGPLFVFPRGWVMFIGFLCFVMFFGRRLDA